MYKYTHTYAILYEQDHCACTHHTKNRDMCLNIQKLHGRKKNLSTKVYFSPPGVTRLGRARLKLLFVSSHFFYFVHAGEGVATHEGGRKSLTFSILTLS